PPVPLAILENINADYWRVCWETDAAGIISKEPSLVSKSTLFAKYPHIVEAWETKQREEKDQARQIEYNLLAFSRYLSSPKSKMLNTRQVEPEVACDQNPLPGMIQHWGEVRRCEIHPRDQANIRVCKGCLVSNYIQEDRGFDRKLIMARGARVPVCKTCAAAAVEVYGIGHRGCVCNNQWSCFRCRENELGKLAKARKESYIEGSCGRCANEGNLTRHVDYCLFCRKMRVYA
ncbi:hypothetical protein BKA66DRAFT_400749, partial [Pyrenochaeta sp. MPI-SDFR-AT-0127]